MGLRWIVTSIFQSVICHKLGKKLRRRKVNCVCTLIVFSVIWYSYDLLIANGIPNSYGPLIAMDKIRARLVDVTTFEKQLKQDTNLTKAWTKEVVFHRIEKCFNTSSCEGSDKEKDCVHDKIGSLFKCNHVMVLANRDLGRTGNQMFQVAALLGVAHFHGYTAVIDPSMSITSWFDLPNCFRIKLEHTLNHRENRCCVYDSSTINLSHAHNWTLHGYYQSWRYFERAEKIIRTAFKIKEKYRNDADDFIKRAVSGGVHTIGVHVRRGDFTMPSAQKKGYVMAPLSFIQRAMNYLREKHRLVHFFIVSDDKSWCYNNLQGTNVTIAPFMSTVGFDMAVLALCNHVIVTSGSFGWWGAWLSGGDVVYWTGYPGNSTWLDEQTNRGDYYPNTWVGLS